MIATLSAWYSRIASSASRARASFAVAVVACFWSAFRFGICSLSKELAYIARIRASQSVWREPCFELKRTRGPASQRRSLNYGRDSTCGQTGYGYRRCRSGGAQIVCRWLHGWGNMTMFEIWKKVISPTQSARRGQVVRPKLDWLHVVHGCAFRKAYTDDSNPHITRRRGQCSDRIDLDEDSSFGRQSPSSIRSAIEFRPNDLASPRALRRSLAEAPEPQPKD
jgi:hypothetical protein